MNTSSTHPTTPLSRWTHFSRKLRRSLGFSLSAGLTIALLLANFIVGCKEEGPGILNVCVTPTVIRTSPANGVTNVPLNKISDGYESAIAGTVKKSATLAKTATDARASAGVATVKVISATFSTPMDPNSITTSTFTVWQGNTPVLGGVSYTDTTAFFVIPNGLEPNLTYTCTITTGVRDVAGNRLAEKYIWTFATAAAASPAVSSTDPVNAATGVALNKKVAATFSTTMDASTLTSATFTMKQGTAPVQGFVSYSGTTAIFAPTNNLLPNRVYTATITSGVKDLAGNALASNYVWSFTTGTSSVVSSPTVSFTDPANAATDVPLNQKLAATFSTAMDASTFNTPTFILRRGTTSVQGFVSFSGTTAIFAPSSFLVPNTAYTATITTEAKDLAGNALENDYVWTFTTGSAVVITPPAVSFTDPLNTATGVALNQKLAATFTKTMDATTLTSSTFTLTQGTTPIQGFVSYSGTTAIFAPTSNLASSTVYTATITTGAKDLAGNALANNFVWSFTTGAAVVVIPPTVSSTNPVNVATGVALNQKISATFSTTMDASTFNTPTFTLRQGATSIQGFVSYSGTTAIFAPASNLLPNLTYVATITTAAKDLAGNALATNFEWSFTTGAAVVVIPPTVSFTDPVDAEISVALNTKLAATFSTTMDASTIHSSTFTLRQGTTPIQGFVSYSGTTAIFAPLSNLSPNTVYIATISSEVKDLAGNSMVNNYLWSFTTGAGVVIIPPTVSSTDPANTATDVALNQKIAAVFSKTMNASLITTSTFTLKQGTTPIQGFVSYSGITAIFAPTSNLAANTVYTATITTGAKDLAGNALANDYVWSFTTGAAVAVTPPIVSSTDPANAATGVASNKKIAATFSKTMDASTFTTPTFILRQGVTSVPGYVSYSGTTAIFTPASELSRNTTYTATITTEAKDLAGNALANDYVWSFTTAVTTSPTVIRTDPVNTEICVAVNKHITATFSRPMNGATITTAIFTIMETQGARFVSGVVSYVDTTATFTPLIDLTPNTNYTATITTGAKDLAGNPMSSNYVWTFTTVAPYTVSLSSSPTVGGSTSGGGTFNSCASVTVIATPGTGYSFVNWTENGTPVSINTNYTFTLNGNRALVANFAINTYSLIVTPVPLAGGTVNQDPDRTVYDYGSNVVLAAIPAVGYSFTNWSGDTSGSTNPITITMIANKNINANFEAIPQYNVAVSSNPLAGGLTGGGGTFYSGESVTVTATPNVGYTFANWTEGVTIVSSNANYTFSLSGNRTLVANFNAIPDYIVTLSSIPLAGGSTGGGGTFSSGSSVTVTATGNAGYAFTNWTEGVTIVSTNAVYTFTISGNRNLVANFTLSLAPGSPDLGLAASYGLAAYSAITNVPTESSVINGDASIQINPITSMTGFTFSTPAGAGVVTGSVHAGDAVATNVYTALLAAYNYAKTRTPDAGLFVVGTVDLGSVDIPILPGHVPGRLPPGVYSSGTAMNINTDVVLDGGGDPNAVWVFQIGSSLTTTTGSVTLTGGAQQKNVFFVPTASASIGTNTTFYGNILAGASITLAGNNTVFGRLLSGALGAGQIDMNGLASTITVPGP